MALVNIKFSLGKGGVPELDRRVVGTVHMVCSAAVDGVPFAGVPSKNHEWSTQLDPHRDGPLRSHRG